MSELKWVLSRDAHGATFFGPSRPGPADKRPQPSPFDPFEIDLTGIELLQ